MLGHDPVNPPNSTLRRLEFKEQQFCRQPSSYILLVNSLLDEFIHHSISALVDITS